MASGRLSSHSEDNEEPCGAVGLPPGVPDTSFFLLPRPMDGTHTVPAYLPRVPVGWVGQEALVCAQLGCLWTSRLCTIQGSARTAGVRELRLPRARCVWHLHACRPCALPAATGGNRECVLRPRAACGTRCVGGLALHPGAQDSCLQKQNGAGRSNLPPLSASSLFKVEIVHLYEETCHRPWRRGPSLG